MRRIGIYGGSFNPPHLGHVLAARNARALLRLDEILFIPAAIPPHKAVAGGSPDGETRLALTELAIAGEPGMSVSRIELDRPGPSYTVDTLRALRESYGQDELFLLMGTDMFLSFFQWREPEAIAKLATPVCMARVRADAALSAALQQQSQAVETAFGVRPIVLQNECLEISSTEARRLLFFGIADGLLHPHQQRLDLITEIHRFPPDENYPFHFIMKRSKIQPVNVKKYAMNRWMCVRAVARPAHVNSSKRARKNA